MNLCTYVSARSFMTNTNAPASLCKNLSSMSMRSIKDIAKELERLL